MWAALSNSPSWPWTPRCPVGILGLAEGWISVWWLIQISLFNGESILLISIHMDMRSEVYTDITLIQYELDIFCKEQIHKLSDLRTRLLQARFFQTVKTGALIWSILNRLQVNLLLFLLDTCPKHFTKQPILYTTNLFHLTSFVKPYNIAIQNNIPVDFKAQFVDHDFFLLLLYTWKKNRYPGDVLKEYVRETDLTFLVVVVQNMVVETERQSRG